MGMWLWINMKYTKKIWYKWYDYNTVKHVFVLEIIYDILKQILNTCPIW